VKNDNARSKETSRKSVGKKKTTESSKKRPRTQGEKKRKIKISRGRETRVPLPTAVPVQGQPV